MNLDVVRIYGCGTDATELGRISTSQIERPDAADLVMIGSDFAGFIYLQHADRRVFSFDTDGGEVRLLASNLDDFFERLVFGPDGAKFAGEDWVDDLRSAGSVD